MWEMSDSDNSLEYSGQESNSSTESREPVRTQSTVQPRDVNVNCTRVVSGDPDRVVVPPILEPVTYYDQNLTSKHKYLGDGLHETSGRTIFEENIIHTIPIVFFKLNLIPGQILPIIARSSSIKLVLKYAIARNRVFGVSYELNEKGKTFGTIAEVYEHSIDLETSTSFQIKAMGHQRFEILNVDSFPDSNNNSIGLAQIKIIPDITLKYPYKVQSIHPKFCRENDIWQVQWPKWVYNQFDVQRLASRVKEKVKMFFKDISVSDDPFILSFQITRLGIFTQDQISHLLGIESTNLRLQHELRLWNENQSMQTFMCARPNCGVTICNMNSVFAMSPEGPQGTYCNSWGQIHDMITVTELDYDIDVITVGKPSTECSWFPGYRWLIIICPNCRNHLGWRYLANENSSLVPRVFYGLCTRSVTSTKNYLLPNDNDSNTSELTDVDGYIPSYVNRLPYVGLGSLSRRQQMSLFRQFNFDT